MLTNLGSAVPAMWDRLPACPGCKAGGQSQTASPALAVRAHHPRAHAMTACIPSIRDRLEAYPTLPAAFAHARTSSRNDNVLLMHLP